MKWYKEPVFYWMLCLSVCNMLLGYVICLWSLTPLLEKGMQDSVPQKDVQELVNQAYRYGKQVARDDCRRVRDKEE